MNSSLPFSFKWLYRREQKKQFELAEVQVSGAGAEFKVSCYLFIMQQGFIVSHNHEYNYFGTL